MAASFVLHEAVSLRLSQDKLSRVGVPWGRRGEEQSGLELLLCPCGSSPVPPRPDQRGQQVPLQNTWASLHICCSLWRTGGTRIRWARSRRPVTVWARISSAASRGPRAKASVGQNLWGWASLHGRTTTTLAREGLGGAAPALGWHGADVGDRMETGGPCFPNGGAFCTLKPGTPYSRDSL